MNVHSIARQVGFIGASRLDGLRFHMLDIVPRFGLSLELILFSDPPHYSLKLQLFWPMFYIRLWNASYEPKDSMCDSWGFAFVERGLHLNWGAHTKIVDLPWDWSHVRWDVRLPDGTWVPKTTDEYQPPYSDGREVREFTYSYVRKNGVVQVRTATVYAERGFWVWRWLRWLGWPMRKWEGIDIRFNDEVGERSGSWKGGTTGCSYESRLGEGMEDPLRRMERERKF